MPEEKWYQDPEKATRAAVFAILLAGGALTWWLAGDQVNTMFALAVSGDVDGLAEYFRSFGAWAIVVSFVLDVLINAGSVFPSIFISTANGLIFGLPLGILISWLAETTGVVISFWLMRYLFRSTAEKMIAKSSMLMKIDDLSGRKGLQWMALARMLPYFPSGILTAIGAVSKISTRDYIIANLIGKFPSTALEVVIGHDLVNFQQHSERLAVLVTLVIIIFIAYKRFAAKKNKD